MRILLLLVIIFASAKLAYKIKKFDDLEEEELFAYILGIVTDIFIIIVIVLTKEVVFK